MIVSVTRRQRAAGSSTISPEISASNQMSGKRAMIAAAVLGALGSSSAFAANVYWDINGNTAGSGATAGAANATWNTTNLRWNTDAGGAGVDPLTAEVTAANIGVFSAGSDATATSTVTISGGTNHAIGGFTIEEGNVSFIGSNVTTATGSTISMPNADTTINVPANSTLSMSAGGQLCVLSGSGIIHKTGAGTFDNATLSGTAGAAAGSFTGKWDVSQGTLTVGFGNTANMLGVNPATLAAGADLLTVSNNASLFFENSGTVTNMGNRGMTVGTGGATLDLGHGVTPGTNVSFSGQITGDSSALITVLSVNGTGGQSYGAALFAGANNSTTYFGKWLFKGGEIRPDPGSTGGTDLMLGAVPTTPLADAITLDGGSLRGPAAITIAANRGITLGAAGGKLHALNAAGVLTVNSAITGNQGGGITVNLQADATPGVVVLTNANTYDGSTSITCGTLRVSGGSAIPDASAVSLANFANTTFDLNGSNEAIGSLSGGGTTGGTVSLGAGTLTTGGNNSSTTYAGAITGSGGLTKAGSGTMTVTGNYAYTGGTSVTGGKLSLGKSLLTSSSVSASNDGVLELSSNGTFQKVIKTPSVSVTGTAKIDLSDNKMIVSGGAAGSTWNGATYGGVTGLVASGYNGGTNDGTGIVTTQSNAISPNVLTQLVSVSADDSGYAGGSFSGQAVSSGDQLVMYTWGGDANLDGTLNGDDYFQIDSHFNQDGLVFGYFNGDFNYDGAINGDDYFIIDSNFNAGSTGTPFPTSGGVSAGLAGVTAVPEPASLSVLAIAACGLAARRRRRN